MFLLDHFHPPLNERFEWESFHSTWATRIADVLNDRWLSPEFLAAEHTHAGSNLEIDVATFELPGGPARGPDGGSVTATLQPQLWSPPAAAASVPAVFPDSFEVRVFNVMGGRKLVGAIELVSPSNKDRPEERRAFATKVAAFLHQGVSVIIMDIVTTRRTNLHNEVVRLMQWDPSAELPADAGLYAVAYRPVLRDQRPAVDLWMETFDIGSALPTMPLRLTGDIFVPIEFEATYQEACRRRRLT
jgi:hypothetical protein